MYVCMRLVVMAIAKLLVLYLLLRFLGFLAHTVESVFYPGAIERTLKQYSVTKNNQRGAFMGAASKPPPLA